MMIRKFLLIFVGFAASLSLSAQVVSPWQAQAKARQFLAQRGKTVAGGSWRMQMPAAGGQAAPYYVFNQPGGQGYVVVAGDERAADILGYADEGSLDLEQAPPQLKAWLQGYADELAALPETDGQSQQTNDNAQLAEGLSGDATEGFTPVAPLLGQTQWDQTFPYNLLTPCYVGTTHSATGCAATAMAQIMFFHRHPAQGQGQTSYRSGQYNMDLSADFSESQYQWNLMQPVYADWDSDESRQAVALLMRDCGYAISMDYGATSGALPDAWPRALIDYFDYDRSLANRYRENYALGEWNRIIRDEIAAGRPVFAGGFSSAGGHAFVFDGYDADGLIHVNWGWSGVSNGYFRTSALSPAIQGVGGSSGGFNSRQSIITGIRPAVEGSFLTPEFLSSETVKTTPASGTLTRTYQLRLTGKIANGGYCDATVDFGFGVFSVPDGRLELVFPAEEAGCAIAKDAERIGIKAADVSFASLADGDYQVFPLVREQGDTLWTKVRDKKAAKPNYLKLHVSDGQLTTSQPTNFQLSAERVALDTKLYQGVRASVSAVLRNQGDMAYSSEVKAVLYNPADQVKVAESEAYLAEVYPQDSARISIVSAFSAAPGTYLLALTDENQQPLNDFVEVSLEAAPAAEGTAVAGAQLTLVGSQEQAVADDLCFEAHLSSPDGIYANHVTVYIYDEFETTTTPLGSLEPQFVFIEPGQQADVLFSGRMENGVVGVRYKATLIDKDYNVYIKPRAAASCYFTLADPSTQGVSTAAAAHQGDARRVFDLQGRPADGRRLKPGLYVSGSRKLLVR